jgi:membrane protease YdiL (CAAX protease family)
VTERVWAAAELVLAVALVLGANVFDVVPVSETVWLVGLGVLSLRRRGLGWRHVGLEAPRSWSRTVGYALAAGIGLQLASEFAIEPLTGRPDLSSLRPLVGNLGAALQMLMVAWALAAFGEELAYRGYVLERAAALGHHSRAAYAVGVVVVSALFGLGHVYQGVAGVIGTGLTGLLLGSLYLASGRNLWLPILTHGFSNTIAVAWIYLGLAPGLDA